MNKWQKFGCPDGESKASALSSGKIETSFGMEEEKAEKILCGCRMSFQCVRGWRKIADSIHGRASSSSSMRTFPPHSLLYSLPPPWIIPVSHIITLTAAMGYNMSIKILFIEIIFLFLSPLSSSYFPSSLDFSATLPKHSTWASHHHRSPNMSCYIRRSA